MEFPREIHIHVHGLDDALKKYVVAALETLLQRTENIMATLDQITQDIQDEATSIAGVSTLIAGLKQQLADALSGTTLPPAVQTKVDAIFAGAEANKAALAAALTTTPSGSPVPPVASPAPSTTPPGL